MTLEKTGDLTIINIRDRVFLANVDTAIVITSKAPAGTVNIGEMQKQSVSELQKRTPKDFQAPAYILSVSTRISGAAANLLQKIEERSVNLDQVASVSTGLKAYQRGKGKPPQTNREKDDRVFHSVSAETPQHGRYLDGVDVARYSLGWSGHYLKYGDWLAEPRRSVPFDGPRILIRQIPSKPPYCINGIFTDLKRYHDINSMVVFNAVLSFEYLLGVLNSRLISFWFAEKFQKFQRKIFPQFKVKELKLFPIRTIDFENPTDKARHDRMMKLVEGMLDLNRRIAGTTDPHTTTVLQRQVETTDREIDRLVYDLYGLTEEEIKIVEGEIG